MAIGARTSEQYGDMPPVAAYSSDFEVFKKRLRILSIKMVRADLADKLELGAGELLVSMTGEGKINYPEAVQKYILLADAERQLTEYLGGSGVAQASMRDPVPWLAIAREQLDGYIEQNPDHRSILRKSIFYIGMVGELRRLGQIVTSRTLPGGDYDARSFSAGVAIGAIQLRPY